MIVVFVCSKSFYFDSRAVVFPPHVVELYTVSAAPVTRGETSRELTLLA